MQAYLQKLANLNLVKNVPIDLMRYVLGFLQIQESLTKMQSLEDKNKRMYPVAKGGSASKKRKQKENRTKSKRPRVESEEKSCQRVFSLVVTSSYEDKMVESHLSPK